MGLEAAPAVRFGACLVVAACAGAPEAPPASPPGPAPEARLPVAAGRFLPALAEVQAGGEMTGLAAIEGCGSCHADVAAQWQSSAHSFASFNNPIYRASVERLRRDRGATPSRFCGGCHDVALLFEGALDRDVSPDDPRAHTGVTCRTCHSLAEVRADGNASYVLDPSPIPIPVDGDPASVARHKARVAPAPLRSAEMCTACHRAFLSTASGNAHHLVGQDDATPWARSAYAGSVLDFVDDAVEEQTCQGCHMAQEPVVLGDPAAQDGTIASHRVLGAHSWLAAMRRDSAQLARIEAFLRGSVTVDVAAATSDDGIRTLPAEGAPLRPGGRVVLDVVVRNQRVGHKFPGGTLDAQDAWLELAVTDARGRRVAEAGTRHQASGDDPSAHRFRSVVADTHGQPQLARETHNFHAGIYDASVAPRDARVVQYAFRVPPGAAQPLRVTARLRHRSRMLSLQQIACGDARAPRGRAFARAAESRGDVTDPCAPQPVLELAEATVFLGEGWRARQVAIWKTRAPAPTWRRLYDHALGLRHDVQERLHVALPSLEKALAEVEATGTGRDRAMVLALLGRLAAHEGRTADALALFDRAAAALPGHAAIDALRGDALAQVWRWREAAVPLARAALAAPRDDRAWTALALALGSSGQDAAALEAARRGLELRPRDPDLLRLQALSLAALGASPAATRAAMDAYLECRPPDDAPRVRNLCQKTVPGCALERLPVHVHEMKRP